MKFIDTTISVGADKPFELLHISDIHLTYADDRDDERKLALAKDRRQYFTDAQENLDAAAADARRTGALMICTGDLLDFVSWANIDAARRFTDENDCFFAAGNHEFSLYVGEAWEDEAYRNQSLEKVQSAYKNDIRFSVRTVNGVKLIAIDNSYYLFDRSQLEGLRKECAEGMPVILMMHVPLYAEDIAREIMEVRSEPCAYVMNAPDGLLAGYSEHRRRQQRADDITREAYDYIVSEPAIKAVIAGHVHGEPIESRINDRLIQYTVGTRSARRITVI